MADDLYSGLAIYGKITTTISAIVTCVLGVVLIVIARNHGNDDDLVGIDAKIANVNCNPRYCSFDASYVVDGKGYDATGLYISPDSNLPTEKTHLIYYDPKNPSYAEGQKMTSNMRWWLMALGVILPLISIGIAWLAFNYKGFAAFEGTMGAINAFRN